MTLTETRTRIQRVYLKGWRKETSCEARGCWNFSFRFLSSGEWGHAHPFLQDGDALVFERLAELHHLRPLRVDGEGGHDQVSPLTH